MPISGETVIKILQKHGFIVNRQKGSHVVLSRQIDTSKRVVVVPKHKEMKKGILRSIARQSGVLPEEFGL